MTRVREFWKQLRFFVSDTFASRKHRVADPHGSQRRSRGASGARGGGIANTSIDNPAFKDFLKDSGSSTPPVPPRSQNERPERE